MMEQDEILTEVRRFREEYAARFDFDIDAICRSLRQEVEEEKRQTVRFAPRPSKRGAGKRPGKAA